MISVYTVLLIVLAIIVVVYNICIISKAGIPESISATSYFFKEFNGKYWLFTIFCFICGLLLFPPWVNISIEKFQFLPFLSCAGILFAGATPLFRESMQKEIHYSGGIIAVLSCVLWLFFNGFYLTLYLEALILFIIISIDKKNYVYYIEIVGLLGLIWTLLELYR